MDLPPITIVGASRCAAQAAPELESGGRGRRQMNIVGPVGGGATDSLPVRRTRFTYLDYLELRGWEFEKFRHLPTITREQIAAVNWPVLARMFAGQDAEA